MPSNITVRTTDSKLEEFCKVIADHKLFLSCGIMQTWCKTPQYIKIAALAYDGDNPIGAALLMKRGHGLGNIRFGVYVTSKMRRQKIGSRIVKAVFRRNKRGFLVFKDRLDSRSFYNSLDLNLQTGKVGWF
jgi:predicted acetyltransferase